MSTFSHPRLSLSLQRVFVAALLLLLAGVYAMSPSLAATGATPAAKDKATKGKAHAVERSDHAPTHKVTLTESTPQPVLDAAAKSALQQDAQKLDVATRKRLDRLAETLHQEDKAIQNELRDDEELSTADIGMLWEAAVERSGTIRYAIEKLSRRDATGKPVGNDTFSKRMVQNLVHLGGVAGSMWTQSPVGMIGSNMVQGLISGSPDQSALSHITDADMVILAKEVEALRSQLIESYYTYRHAQRLTLSHEASQTILKSKRHAEETASATGDDTTTAALAPLMQSIVDTSHQEEQSAQQAYNSARSGLALLVGTDAIAALEQANAGAGAPKKAATNTP